MTYTLCCSSEPLRISKLCTVFSGTLCPTSEKSAAVMTSEGRILLWDVEFEQVLHQRCMSCSKDERDSLQALKPVYPLLPCLQVGLHGQEFPDDASPPPLLSAYPVEPGLVDLSSEAGRGEPTEKLTLADTIAPHWFSPPEGTVCLTTP